MRGQGVCPPPRPSERGQHAHLAGGHQRPGGWPCPRQPVSSRPRVWAGAVRVSVALRPRASVLEEKSRSGTRTSPAAKPCEDGVEPRPQRGARKPRRRATRGWKRQEGPAPGASGGRAALPHRADQGARRARRTGSSARPAGRLPPGPLPSEKVGRLRRTFLLPAFLLKHNSLSFWTVPAVCESSAARD